jgi:ATP-dependent DNA helicase 2 subunit 2
MKVADVKKVPPRVKGRARYRDREADKPISGLDIDALLKKGQNGDGSGPKKTIQIDPLNAIPEFKRLMHSPDDEELIRSGVKQMGAIVEEQVKTSFGDANYNRAVEMLGVVRNEMVDFEFSEFYNDMIHGLKRKLLREELGGDRREFWWRVRISRLGLIDENEVETSKVGKDEAQKFMTLKE